MGNICVCTAQPNFETFNNHASHTISTAMEAFAQSKCATNDIEGISNDSNVYRIVIRTPFSEGELKGGVSALRGVSRVSSKAGDCCTTGEATSASQLLPGLGGLPTVLHSVRDWAPGSTRRSVGMEEHSSTGGRRSPGCSASGIAVAA